VTTAPRSEASPAMPLQLGYGLLSPPVPAPGEKRKGGRGHIDSYGDGRVCGAPRCDTNLSRYNAATVCANHGIDQLGTIRPGGLRIDG